MGGKSRSRRSWAFAGVGVLFSAALLFAAACGSDDSSTPPATVTDAARDTADTAIPTRDTGITSEAGCPAPALSADAVVLPPLTGSYGVARGGRRTLIDGTRAADPTLPTTSADAGSDASVDGGGEGGAIEAGANPIGRALSVELWYPTDPCPTGATVPWLDDIEGTTTYSVDGGAPDYKRVQTHAVSKAPFAADGAKPLVLFSPGYSALPREYTAVIEDLVSHGYVVAAISHTYWTPFTVFADGSNVAATHLGTMIDQAGELGVWLADARFVIDELVKANGADPLGEIQGHLDLDKIGMYGHSFGGGTALDLLAQDPRAKAAIDFDGPMLSSTALAKLSSPFLLFKSDRGADLGFIELFADAVGPAYSLTLLHSMHGSFTDFGAINVLLGTPDPTDFGTIDPVRALAVVNAYDVAFFDKHLAGKSAPLLDGTSASYPEVMFAKKP